MEGKVYCCQTCNKGFSSPLTYQQHLQSEKHLKQTRMTSEKALNNNDSNEGTSKSIAMSCTPLNQPCSKITDITDKSILCEICNKKCTGIVPYQQHLESKNHQKQLERMKLHESLMLLNAKDKGDGNLVADPKGENSHYYKNNSLSPYNYCSLCQKTVSGIIPYMEHINGEGHKKCTKNAELVNSLNFSSVSSNTGKSLSLSKNEPTFSFHCEDCYLSFSGPVPYHQHMVSNRHLKRIEKNQILKELTNSFDVNGDHINSAEEFTQPLSNAENSIKENSSMNSSGDHNGGICNIVRDGHHNNLFKNEILQNKNGVSSFESSSSKHKPSVCNDCSAPLEGHESAREHLCEKKHLKVGSHKMALNTAEHKNNFIPSKPSSEKQMPENTTCNNNAISKDVIEKSNVKLETSAVKDDLKCNNCSITFADISELISHLESDEHYKTTIKGKNHAECEFVVIDELELFDIPAD